MLSNTTHISLATKKNKQIKKANFFKNSTQGEKKLKDYALHL